jgi:WD40 repeat protein
MVFCAHAGNAIATSGEDGQVKIWSRSGMLRSTIMEAEDPVYCLAWGGSAGSQLLVCSGSTVSIRSLQGVASGPAAGAGSGISSSRGAGNNSSSNVQVSWKAHEGVVLKADWNAITGLIVTGGEDCKYKVWSCTLLKQHPCSACSATSWPRLAAHFGIAVACMDGRAVKPQHTLFGFSRSILQ